MRRFARGTERGGFTLVELMVVMIVMVILFGIGLPVLIRLQGSGGVDRSARRLQAVMINARALAARYNVPHSVVWGSFDSSISKPAGGTTPWSINSSYSPDNYYEVIRHNSDGSWPGTNSTYPFWQCNTSYSVDDIVTAPNGYIYKCTSSGTSSYSITFHTDEAAHTSREGCAGDSTCLKTHGNCEWSGLSASVSGSRVGERYYLEPSAVFTSFTFYGSKGHTWSSDNYGVSGRGYPIANGKNRVTFLPTGEAYFRAPFNAPGQTTTNPADGWVDGGYGAKNGVYQSIAICKDGDPNVRLRVVVNRYSGEVMIKGASDEDAVE